MGEQLCPEIHYKKDGDRVVLTGCYGIDGKLYIPDEIEGHTVYGIGPYAFSEAESEADRVYLSSEAGYLSERHRICTEEVEEIRLPGQVREIGRYAFYRCRNLKKLILSDSLLEIGGGAFTGCRLGEVEIHFYRGEKSALKSVVDEIRYTVRAVLHHHGEDNKVQVARLLFPEHYEEAVENTPARLLVTHHHGSGGYYRQCFYSHEVDYKKYDEVLPYAVAEEKEETVVELAFGRLMYPYRLSEAARASYLCYLRGHMEAVGRYVAEHEAFDEIRFLSQEGCWTSGALEEAVTIASRLGRTELVGVLMDVRQKLPAGKRKRFEL
ncbi:leucine-rich repeat protein [Extibacter muris]|uniref:leucine-rich repeat protein n=1 Tax=Extibacter muris TaxID=1796622 RepID=UPI001D089F01|nr:leucine-rich repeat domain-containing protein [Extibacter muris]MCB6201042.1 leucine-rich repeat domain-containing protein [Extibacter muris]MCQ4662372.1 leucine-rich repeat domain-containing protein [Extibacter muris]MCQ4691701.1 leucine-rich repeat domain-containing protein [Extibacter muris]